MSLSDRTFNILEVALADTPAALEVSSALDAATGEATPGVTKVSPSVVDNIVTFSDVTGTCKDSGVAISAIAGKAAKPAGATIIGNIATFADVDGNLSNPSIPGDNVPVIATPINLAGAAPTAAQMATALGTAKIGMLSDSSDATKSYLCFNDGTNLFYVAGTRGV